MLLFYNIIKLAFQNKNTPYKTSNKTKLCVTDTTTVYRTKPLIAPHYYCTKHGLFKKYNMLHWLISVSRGRARDRGRSRGRGQGRGHARVPAQGRGRVRVPARGRGVQVRVPGRGWGVLVRGRGQARGCEPGRVRG